jgi:D,D-heptose 1,7-bisphosphate phosphatase
VSGSEASASLRPAVFLDRDGTLIEERHYLSDPDGVVLLAGVGEALKALRDAGFALVLATNQSGLARGLLSEEDYRAVAGRVEDLLARAGVRLDGIWSCPHHPDVDGPCACRKPGTGMFREAARYLRLDLSRSYFVGDRARDVLPALELGGKGILVLTGYGMEERGDLPGSIEVAEDLFGATEWILADAGPDLAAREN